MVCGLSLASVGITSLANFPPDVRGRIIRRVQSVVREEMAPHARSGPHVGVDQRDLVSFMQEAFQERANIYDPPTYDGEAPNWRA